MGNRNGHAFGAVDGGSTANGNQTIAAMGFVNLGGSPDCRFCWVGGRLVKHGHLNARQRIQRLLQNTCSLDALVCHDERLVNTDPLALLLQKLNGAEIDLNLGDVIDEGHGVLL
ncbi:MAG: hypothetical protein RI994_1892 [Pseudomonadota bacterium]